MPDGSVDMVLTFRNVHNWMGDGSADAMFKAMYAALKPGGILGVEEHRAKNTEPQDPKAESGYVRTDYLVALAEKAGFKLIGESEINANPKDTADHPNGVWSLPPTLQGWRGRPRQVPRDRRERPPDAALPQAALRLGRQIRRLR